MEKFLDDDVTRQLNEVFAGNLKEPVRLIYFLEPDGCESCSESIQLLNEVAGLSDKISVEVHDMGRDAALADEYHIENAPGFVVAADDGSKVVDYGIRYAGTPAGYEFTSLINDLVMVSQRDSGLAPETREFLKSLDKDVKLQVFVTPTCPYCPASVNQAHAMAMESARIQAEMVEANEFPDLAAQFNVSGVPQTTINAGRGTLIGSGPESALVAEIKKALLN